MEVRVPESEFLTAEEVSERYRGEVSVWDAPKLASAARRATLHRDRKIGSLSCARLGWMG